MNAGHSVRVDPTPRVKTQKQIDAEAKARQIAEARRRAGMCQRDVYIGFNCRVACERPAGHEGACSAWSW